MGRGWHQEKWDVIPTPNVEGFPTHEALSKVSRDNPVLLTHASGHAAFEEDIKGSLTPGKLADITVLSKDILSIPEDEVRAAEVSYTIVDGKVLFKR